MAPKTSGTPLRKPVEVQRKTISVKNVRNEMKLVGDKCSCKTTVGHPCTMRSSSTRDKIDSQILSLFDETLTPEDLMDGLRELVSLVHCSRYHQGDKFKEPRIKQWRNIFPAGSAPLSVG